MARLTIPEISPSGEDPPRRAGPLVSRSLMGLGFCSMPPGISAVNRALNRIPRRAEQQHAERLRDTFADSGVASALEIVDHQVVYGRRGTGKTHAFRYLESTVSAEGDIPVYIDLRTIGSPDGLFLGEVVPDTERAARLLIDLLGHFHHTVFAAALDDDDLGVDEVFAGHLDSLLAAATAVRVVGETEVQNEEEAKATEKVAGSFGLGLSSSPSVSIGGSTEVNAESRGTQRATRRGSERFSLNFADVTRALRGLSESVRGKRFWLLLDEWSSVPADIQPLLGEFLVRSIFPLGSFTVKIAAIEQQSNFRAALGADRYVGIELGADVAANISLDEFMVFEQNEDRATEFFRDLLYKHLTAGSEVLPEGLIATEGDVVRKTFTDRRAFGELVRASEGVPRDAINIAAKAAYRAGAKAISVPDVRAAARAWFQTDKESAIRGRPEAHELLNWIIDKVINQKRARGFLVDQRSASASLLLALFDARVLHVVRRGYSAQDAPGQRFDVWVIDYGAYVDLINTQVAPRGLLPSGEAADGSYVDVPTQDLRAIRRAVLDLEEFNRAGA